jgi:hypothetical protein
LSISSIHAAAPAAYSRPTQAATANVTAPDGDTKTPAPGRVKDSDGDYKAITLTSPLSTSSAVQQALSSPKAGG